MKYDYYVIETPKLAHNRQAAEAAVAKQPDTHIMVKRVDPDQNPLILEMVYAAFVELLESTKINPFNVSLNVKQHGKEDEEYTLYRIIHEFRAYLDTMP